MAVHREAHDLVTGKIEVSDTKQGRVQRPCGRPSRCSIQVGTIMPSATIPSSDRRLTRSHGEFPPVRVDRPR